jgi:hypothetical protein
MKPTTENTEQIRKAFAEMQTRGDLLNLLNTAKPMVYGEKAIPFALKQLTWYTNPKLGSKRYSVFKIKKKSGMERTIHAPVNGLKSLQKTLSFVLQCVYEPHNAAMGFVRDKSIVNNAQLHVGSKYVYNIDLKDFFPSVDQARVWKCLQLHPFNLTDKQSDSYLSGQAEINTIRPEYTLSKGEIDDNTKFYLKSTKLVNRNLVMGMINGGVLTIEIKNNKIKIIKEKSDWKYLTERFDEIYQEYINDKTIKTNPNHKLNFHKLLLSSVLQNQILDDIITKEKPDRKKIANIIASLCSTEMEVERKNERYEWEKVKRNVLPQGAPTSPVITNIVCQRLDYLLSGVAKRFGLKYSRYADDITFSSMHNVYQPESAFLKELHRIIAEQNFHIKESKTRLQKEGYRKEVTGLLVNEKVNVQQRYIKQLRMWLYYWERYGYKKLCQFFPNDENKETELPNANSINLKKTIEGKINFLGMVRGKDDKQYQALLKRFEILTQKENSIPLVLDHWEKYGIEAAMKLYYSTSDATFYEK